MKINLGCGNRKFKDFVNVDRDKGCNPEVVADLNEKLPFKDNEADYVVASHVIEHVDDVFEFMYEIWRISKNGARIEVIAPNFTYSHWAIQPQHKRFIRPKYFEQWDPTYHGVENYEYMTHGAKFKTLSEAPFNEDRELYFILEVVKDVK